MIACGRRCCLCHKFCGVGMECHHILKAAAGGKDTIDNCIPLCFDCHTEVGHYSNDHPKGTKFSEAELRAHRDSWYAQTKTGISSTAPTNFIDLDRKLYRRIILILRGSNGMIHFRDHDYGERYHVIIDHCLEALLRLRQLPETEFFDTQVEASFSDLISTITEYQKVATNRIWWDTDKTSGIPREWVNGDRYGNLQEERFWEAVEVMNNAATRIWDSYAQFVRTARRQLAAEEPSWDEIEIEFKKAAAAE